MRLRAETRRHLRSIGIRIAAASTTGRDATVATIGIAAIAVADTGIARHAAGSGKRAIVGRRRTAETIALRTDFLTGPRLGNIASLLWTLTITR